MRINILKTDLFAKSVYGVPVSRESGTSATRNAWRLSLHVEQLEKEISLQFFISFLKLLTVIYIAITYFNNGETKKGKWFDR
jgi:hypothetical protein